MDTRDDDAMNEPIEADGMDTLSPTFTAQGHVDEGTIHAWLDGAFGDAHSATVEQHVSACAECRALVAEARGFIAGASRMVRALDAVPADVVPAADVTRTASRIIAAADATRVVRGSGASDVRNGKRVVPTQRAWYARRGWSAAAALFVMVAGGSYVLSTSGEVRLDSVANTGDVVADSASVSAGARDAVSTSAAVPATVPTSAPASRAASGPAGTPSASRAAARDLERRDAGTPALVAPALAAKASTQSETRISRERDAGLAAGSVSPPPVLADAVAKERKRESVPLAVSAKADTNNPVVAGGRAMPAPAAGAAPPTGATKADPTKAEAAKVGGTVAAARAPSGAPSAPTAMLATKASAPAQSRAAENLSDARRRDEALPSQCWSVQGEPGQLELRLPVELQVPDIDGVKSYGVRWIGWPDATMQQIVRMRVDNDGRLSGESIADEQRVRLVLQRIVNGWQGTATHTIDGVGTVQKVQLKRVSEAMCNP